ncbi:MAG: hypothetical protein WC641_04790 [Patescibacteria group bacterium]
MESDSSVATPAKPIKLWQRRWVKYTIRALGILAFIGLMLLNWWYEFGYISWNGWLNFSAILVATVSLPSVGISWDSGFSRWSRRIAWPLLIVTTVFTVSYVQAWSVDSNRPIIVKNGRTNLDGSFFVNPFSRGKVVLQDFEATEDVAWNRGTATKMSAKFRIVPDEKLVRAFAAKGGDAQAQLESSAKACLGKIFQDMLEWKRPIHDVAETGKLEYRPKVYERYCWSPTPPIYLVGSVTLSDPAGLPVEKVWFSDQSSD